MNLIEGMLEDFRQARVVFLTTYNKEGKESTRQMTNFNENPYDIVWFPTDRNTRKVKDIQENPKVLLTFPSSKENEFYEIEGTASLADQATVSARWRWWYLYWHPAQRNRFWFPPDRYTENRAILRISPTFARTVKR